MSKIAIFGPRPSEHGIITKKDGKVWREVQRVLAEEFDSLEWKGHTLLIPIYSKFDIEVLAIAEKKKYPVELYIPSEEWGSTLPRHQKMLIERMKMDNVKVIPGQMDRLIEMFKQANATYLFPTNTNLGRIHESVYSKPIREFPIHEMKYTKEDEILGQTSLDIPTNTFIADELTETTIPVIPDGITKETYLELLNAMNTFK